MSGTCSTCSRGCAGSGRSSRWRSCRYTRRTAFAGRSPRVTWPRSPPFPGSGGRRPAGSSSTCGPSSAPVTTRCRGPCRRSARRCWPSGSPRGRRATPWRPLPAGTTGPPRSCSGRPCRAWGASVDVVSDLDDDDRIRVDADDEVRVVGASVRPDEREYDAALRPRTLPEFVGQERIKEQLGLLIEGARARGELADHLLFSGPPGLGKTTLAGIVAHEMQVGFRPTSGPALERAGDLAAILTNLDEGDVLFVDEVHRMPRAVEEVLYGALEDFK